MIIEVVLTLYHLVVHDSIGIIRRIKRRVMAIVPMMTPSSSSFLLLPLPKCDKTFELWMVELCGCCWYSNDTIIRVTAMFMIYFFFFLVFRCFFWLSRSVIIVSPLSGIEGADNGMERMLLDPVVLLIASEGVVVDV